MNPDDLASLVSIPGFAVVVAVAILLAFLSKKAAEIGGPIGVFARWWGDRQKRRVQRDRALASEQRGGRDELVSRLRQDVTDLSDRLDRQDDEMAAQRAEHAAEMTRLRAEHAAEMTRLRVEHAAEMARYFDHITGLVGWAHEARVKASAKGIELGAPPAFPTAPTGAC